MNTMTTVTIHVDSATISKEVYNALQASYGLDYNDYMQIMCDQPKELSALQEKGLSFNWGTCELEEFLLMKRDFIKWFLWTISDVQRESYFKYIHENKSRLLNLN
jgi:hypothetical protein